MTSGLNQTQANKLYLQKTVADTATAIETFSNGILSNALNPTTTGGTLYIGNGDSTNNTEIATIASRSTILHLGDGNLSSGGINIGNGTGSSNNVNILNGNYATGQTAGAVNVLTGTHAIGTNGGNMNLFTGSRGTLTIGSSLSNQILFNKQTQFTNGIYNDIMDAIAPTSNMTIGSTINASGSITIGQSTTPVSINKPTINAPLIPNYTYPISLATQIGFQNIQQATTAVATSATPAAVVNIFSYAAPAGVWAITVASRCPNIASGNYYILTLSTANNTNNIYQQLVHHTDATTYYYNNAITFFVQGGQTWYYNVSTSLSSSVNLVNNSMVCTRIA
jgi:hypothetical protein